MAKLGQGNMPIEEFKASLLSVSDVDWIRLAAFIDGEGTIYINRTKVRGKHKNLQHTLGVSITNSSPLLLNWLVNTFGGCVYDKGRNGNPRVRANFACFAWRLNEGQAEVVLRRCLPYMIVKRAQAEIGIAFREMKVTTAGKKWQKVSPEVIAQREDLRNKIHILNSPQLAVKAAV